MKFIPADYCAQKARAAVSCSRCCCRMWIYRQEVRKWLWRLAAGEDYVCRCCRGD